MTEIKFSLSERSIGEAIKKLNDYKDNLNRKCKELCTRLANEGMNVAQTCVSFSPLGSTITLQTEINEEEAGVKAILIAIGKIQQTQDYPPFDTLLAVEFGAGIHYNSVNQNPKASEFDMGVGTFPGQTHAFDDGWYYYGNDNKWHHSSGVEATMPMYNASVNMRERMAEIAREVFRED